MSEACANRACGACRPAVEPLHRIASVGMTVCGLAIRAPDAPRVWFDDEGKPHAVPALQLTFRADLVTCEGCR